MKGLQFSLGLLSVLAVACATPNPVPLSAESLAGIQALADAGEWEAAWDEVDAVDSEELDRATLIAFHSLAGMVAWEVEEWNSCLRHYEGFLRLRGPTADSRLAEERVFQIATELVDGQHKALGIFSNRWRGLVTLQNLAGWSPDSPLAAEALAHAAGYNFDRKRWNEAAVDYQLLLSRHRRSEWGDLATYRLGMCGYHTALDAPTNRPMISSSRHQLQTYLSMYPSGRYRDEALSALDGLLTMEYDYYVGLGDYYQRIGNAAGAERYYQIATDVGADQGSR